MKPATTSLAELFAMKNVANSAAASQAGIQVTELNATLLAAMIQIMKERVVPEAAGVVEERRLSATETRHCQIR